MKKLLLGGGGSQKDKPEPAAQEGHQTPTSSPSPASSLSSSYVVLTSNGRPADFAAVLSPPSGHDQLSLSPSSSLSASPGAQPPSSPSHSSSSSSSSHSPSHSPAKPSPDPPSGSDEPPRPQPPPPQPTIMCLYCTEKINTAVESYCQLGGTGERYWHTHCVERSRERREATMMLMHSMNQLTSTFFERLSTPPTDDDDRSTSNTEEADLDTEGFSSATEGDLTLSEGRGSGGARPRKTVLTLWDDSDVSDAEATLRANSRSSLRRESEHIIITAGGPAGVAAQGQKAAGTVPDGEEAEEAAGGKGQGVAPWGHAVRRRLAALRPQPTFYRSLSFELDSAGNTIRPKPKSQRRDKDKERSGKERAKDRHHRNRDGADPSVGAAESEADGLALSAAVMLPSAHSSDDQGMKEEDVRERPRKKKRSKTTEKSNYVRGNGKCASCTDMIHKDDNYVCVGGNKHHINCFLCSACFKPRFHELQYGKIVCHECLPRCDGCGLPLIPANGKNAKRSNTGQPSQPAETSAGSNGNESKDVEEDGEVIIERDGSVQRYHRKCVLKCASCSRPIRRKRGKLYKKQGKPWCARCISKCNVFEERIFQFGKPPAVSKSRSSSVQGSAVASSPVTMEDLLNDEASIHSFIEFLVNEQSVENILFYLDVEAFKRLKRKQDIIIQANNIYNKYLITEAELEVTAIDAEERKKLTYILASKTGKVKNNFFDSAQKCVFNILKDQAFQRYLQSEEHRALVQANGMNPLFHPN